MLKKWEALPEFMKNDEVRAYYNSLQKKKISMFLKRAMDFVGGVLLLIILAIPMAIIAVMIKLDSEGPVFYRQERVTTYALMGYAGMDYGTFADTRLRDVPYEVFEAYKDHLPELWRRRAEHYYSEFARAEKGAELWREGDLEGYGQLVFESGKSSIYSYECGCDELKKLYEIMWNTDGIYGGRFSGAGFKGCCMALVDPEKVEDIKAKVTEEYLKAFPELEGRYSAYVCESADGVRL